MKNNKHIIDAKSLRIGNFLYDNEVGFKTEFRVTAGDILNIAKGKDYDYSYLQITREWLEKLGFIKTPLEETNPGAGHYYELALSDDKYCDLALLEGDRNDFVEVCLFPYENIRFRYVSEIQNVFYAITGKELIITNTKP